MKQIIGTLCILTITINTLFGQLEVPYKENEIPIHSVKKITGYFGERIDANREGSIKGFDIDKYIAMVEIKKHKDWWWIGEQPGKWLESAVLSSAQSNDTTLLIKAKKILERLEKAQEPSGYLGITDPSIRTPQQPLRGMDAYELYFMLHGLITASQQWNDPQALETAKRLANYLVNHINEGKMEFWPTNLRNPENFHVIPKGHSEIAGHSVHCGLEGTLLIDPVLRLYEITGEKQYLDWGKWIVKNIDKWSGWNTYSRLDSVASLKMTIDQVQPFVHSHTFQMNFLGFLRLYQITGDESILRKVKGVWDDVYKRQSYITGGVSVGEHYEKGYIRPLTNNVVETCATMSWMQLTQQLLLITGNPKYADAIERLLFNHVFASQAFDGDCYRYHTPPNGFKPIDYFHGPDCCTSSGTRIVSMLPLFIYAVANNSIYINQYLASETEITLPNGKVVNLSIKTAYPQSDTITILPKLDHPASFSLNLRMPEWCSNPEVSVNGIKISTIKPGSYTTITRSWKPNDVVKLILPMQLKWIEHDHFSNFVTNRLPSGENMFDVDINTKPTAPFALIRGPIVYAVDDLWWKGSSKPTDVGTETAYVRTDLQTIKQVNLPKQMLGPAYEIQLKTVTGEQVKTLAVPFTNVGLWYRFGEVKPEKNSKAYSYAIWLQDSESADFKLLTKKYDDTLKK